MKISIENGLDQFLDQRVCQGRFRSADQYVGELVRRERRREEPGWDWLWSRLEPGLRAEPQGFLPVTAERVIARNRERQAAKR